jgi:uncharacterized protein with HEPN domain
MGDRSLLRLEHMVDAVEQIELLLADRSVDALSTDRVTRAAFERFLEIASEASRHLPDAWKDEHPEIAWRRLADLGNRLRHAYNQVDVHLLWNVYAMNSGPLKDALQQLTAKHRIPAPPDA